MLMAKRQESGVLGRRAALPQEGLWAGQASSGGHTGQVATEQSSMEFHKVTLGFLPDDSLYLHTITEHFSLCFCFTALVCKWAQCWTSLPLSFPPCTGRVIRVNTP